MEKYLVFTNIWNGYKKCMMHNNFKTFRASTIEEVRTIKKQVEDSGHEVCKVTTLLGTRVEV